MDIGPLTNAIAQCVSPGSTTRNSLRHYLEQLLSTIRHLKTANVEATSLLTHVTLAAVRVLGPIPIRLADRERELSLECLCEALTLDKRKQQKHMTDVHAIVIDHLSRLLVPLFALETLGPNADGRGVSNEQKPAPEPTRMLALQCWRQIFTGIATVYIPQTHPPRTPVSSGGDTDTLPAIPQPAAQTMPMSRYASTYLPPDYLSLAVCALLDNAELSDDQTLRILALDALADILRKSEQGGHGSGILSSRDSLRPIFPGITSALARIALAKPPSSAASQPASDQMQRASANDKDHGGFINDMAAMAISGSTHRKYPAAVRSHALDCIREAVLVLYEGTLHEADENAGSAALIDDIAQRAKAGMGSIIQGAEENEDDTRESESTAASDGGFQNRLSQILRRLAGLRHTEHVQISASLFSLFSAVPLDCAQQLGTQCFSTAIEACLILSGTHSLGPAADQTGFIARLVEECSRNHRQNPVYHRMAGLLESSMPLFDGYVAGGTEQQRIDILYLLAGYMRVLGNAEAQSLLNPWWPTRGLLSFLASLAISLPGTSLLISEVPVDSSTKTLVPGGMLARAGEAESTSDRGTRVPYLLDYYRTQPLSRALDAFINQLADTLSSATLCSQLLSLLLSPNAGIHPQVLWLLSRVVPKLSSEATAAAANIGNVCEPVFQYCVDCFNAHGSNSISYQSEEQAGGDSGSAAASVGGNRRPGASSMDGVLRSCMVLSTISAVIPVVGPGVAYYMDTLLFPLLQISAAASPVLRSEAHRALATLAATTGCPAIPQMLQDNVDYIVEGCSRKMSLVEMYPEVFDILAGTVRLVGEDILVYMDDVVEDTLDACESLMDDEQVTVGALSFLEVVTRTVATSTREKRKAIQDSSEGSLRAVKEGAPALDPIGKALGELQDLEAQEQMAELVDFSDDDEDNSGLDPSGRMGRQLSRAKNVGVVDDDKEPEAGNPLVIKITLAVQNFLSTSSGAQQLLALKILQNSLHALTDTRDVLPLVNEVWPALSHRLDKGRDLFYVTLAACDVVDTVCRTGEGWMRQRVRDDLWVHFRRVLVEASPESIVYSSTERELVRRVLSTMRTVVECVPIDEAIAWDLSWMSLRLVGQKLVEPHAVELLKAMVPAYGDKIWLILAKLGRAGVPPESVPSLGIPEDIHTPQDICQVLSLAEK